MALELTAPTTIEAEAPPLNNDTWAPQSKVEYQFPGTKRTAGETIAVTWYDGKGHKPEREGLGLPDEVMSCRTRDRCLSARRERW